MIHTEAIFCILGVVSAAVVCCCICFCRNINSSASDPLPPPQAPTGPVYFYDMTTAPDDSAPPPYHLAILCPPVNSHQQMNPPVYQEATYISLGSLMY